MSESQSLQHALSGLRTLEEWAKGLQPIGEVIRGALSAERSLEEHERRKEELLREIEALRAEKARLAEELPPLRQERQEAQAKLVAIQAEFDELRKTIGRALEVGS